MFHSILHITLIWLQHVQLIAINCIVYATRCLQRLLTRVLELVRGLHVLVVSMTCADRSMGEQQPSGVAQTDPGLSSFLSEENQEFLPRCYGRD